MTVGKEHVIISGTQWSLPSLSLSFRAEGSESKNLAKIFSLKRFWRKGAAGVSGKVFGAAKYLQKAPCRDAIPSQNAETKKGKVYITYPK